MLYLVIIIAGNLLISALNMIFDPAGFVPAGHLRIWYLAISVAFTITAVAIDGLAAFVIRKMPEKYFDPDRKHFGTSQKRIKRYRKLGIKKWKSKVPELGGFTSFHKDKVRKPNDDEYVGRYMLEACYGIVIHEVSVPAGFLLIPLSLLIFMKFPVITLTVALPVAAVNAVLIYAPAMVLRYNLPKLKILRERNMSRSKNSGGF